MSLSRHGSFTRKALTVVLAGSVACAASISGGTAPAYAEAVVRDGIQTEDGLHYTIDAYDGVVILGPVDSSVREVVIPNSIAGKPVTSIAEDAFRSCSNLENVVVPNSVRSIGDGAFMWCTSLQTIQMPDELDFLGEEVFYDCRNLEDITLPQGDYEIKNHAFDACRTLTQIDIPAGVISIGPGAFSNCSSLMGVSLPASVAYIADDAFEAIGIGSVMTVQTRSQFAFFDSGNGISSGRTTVKYEQGYPVAVTSVQLDKTSLELGSGGYAKLTASVLPVAASDADVSWMSSNESVATVTDEGRVAAVSPGKATITAEAEGVSASCEVTVNADYTIDEFEDSLTVSAKFYSPYDVTWGVSDSSVIQISKYGSSSINNYKNVYCTVVPKGVGTAVLTCYAGGEVKASCTIEVTPGEKTSLSGATISGLEEEYELVDGGVKPKPTVTVDSKTLTEGTDYSLGYTGNTKVGTATLTVTGMGRYEGTKSATFKIVEAVQDISQATVTGIEEEYPLDTNGVEPKPTVTLGGKTLAEGTDYTLAYSNNTAVGTGKIAITGIGKYKGAKTIEFKIVQLDISEAEVLGLEEEYELVEDGVKPEIAVKMGDKTLVENTDYTLTYADNTEIGTGKITITGEGAYKGTKTVEFKIVENVHDMAKAVVSGVEEKYAFEGEAICPEPTVVLGGKMLAKDTDYKVEYFDNDKLGTARLVITGLGDYKGEKTVEFEIVERLKVFTDVPSTAWYHDVVYTAYDNGYINGYSGTDLFGPENNITRGQVACILFNMAGGQLGAKDYSLFSFEDVSTDQYYTEAIAWAKASGVVNGYGDGLFRPESNISAEEFAAMLANYARLTTDWEIANPDAVLSQFDDGDEVSDWARTVVAWAVSEDVMGNGGFLAPTGPIDRARVAAMAVNFQPEPLA